MGETAIDYCDKTLDVTLGCVKRSAGCEHCWALPSLARIAGRFPHGPAAQVICRREGRLEWDPDANVQLLWDNLHLGSDWRKPQFIFVNPKSDLFDNRVPFEYIGQVFDRMWTRRQHRFMVLTKCVHRMAGFIYWYRTTPRSVNGRDIRWPDGFPHVILMVSVESPRHVDRIETLLGIPAAMRGVSFEPLIEPIGCELLTYVADNQCVNCGWVDGHWECTFCGASEDGCVHSHPPLHKPFGSALRLDWVVIGCEKLPGGKAGRWACDDPKAWWGDAEGMVKQCRCSGVAVWMKQGPKLQAEDPGPRAASHSPRVTHRIEDFPECCRVQQKPEGLVL